MVFDCVSSLLCNTVWYVVHSLCCWTHFSKVLKDNFVQPGSCNHSFSTVAPKDKTPAKAQTFTFVYNLVFVKFLLIFVPFLCVLSLSFYMQSSLLRFADMATLVATVLQESNRTGNMSRDSQPGCKHIQWGPKVWDHIENLIFSRKPGNNQTVWIYRII